MLERQESGRSSLDEAYEAGLAALHKDNDWHKPDGGGQWRANYRRAAELVVDAARPHLVPSREQVVEVLRMHRIECAGPGEVTCGGCRERHWMSWWDYHQHLATAVLGLSGITSTEGETQS